MFVHIVLSLLLLIVFLPIIYLTILGTTPSSLEDNSVTIIGIIILLGIASIPWWFVLSGIDVSWLWIVWGGLAGAVIGALAPSWPLFVHDILQLRRKGYTRGLAGAHQNAEETLGGARLWMGLTIVAFGAVTVPLGALIGLGICSLVY